MHVRRFFVIPDDFGAVVTVVNFSENQLSVFDPAILIKPFILNQRLSYRDFIVHEKLDNESGWDRVLTDNVGGAVQGDVWADWLERKFEFP